MSTVSATPWEPFPFRCGSPREREAHEALRALGLFESLRDFTPVLAGTIPLGIDLPASDLDVICCAHELSRFEAVVRRELGGRAPLEVRHVTLEQIPSTVIAFQAHGFRIELFAQPRPVTQQNAYLHLCVEDRLLALGGETARAAIRQLKSTGLKTEPAFARHFGITGEPYATLLDLARRGPEALAAAIQRRG